MKTKTGSINLSEGQHNISIQYFNEAGNAGLKLEWKTPALERASIPSEAFSHFDNSIMPFINTIKDQVGPQKGGNTITIQGIGFLSDETKVFFGETLSPEFRIVNSSIMQAVSPPGNGTTPIIVINPKGTSNSAMYSYDDNAKTRFHLRINAGVAVNDSYGNIWISDVGLITGQRYLLQTEIEGTENDAIYQTFRQTNETPLYIHVNVPNGDYEVNLHFAELSPANSHIGKRIFNVTAEGNYIGVVDIFKEAGLKKALVKTFVTKVDNGTLDIVLSPRNGKPEISAIEVIGK